MKSLNDIFSDIFEPQIVHANSGKDVVIHPYHLVHVLDQEPVNVIEPSEKGPWIAGGACLRWYQGEPVGGSDIDIFCANAMQAEQTLSRIKSWGRFTTKFKSDNAITLGYQPKEYTVYSPMSWNLQVIIKRYYSSLQEVIDNFDITACQIGFDGENWLLNPYTARDIREKNLRMTLPLHPDATKRLTKYWTYGYRPVDGLLDTIMANPESRWAFEATEDY